MTKLKVKEIVLTHPIDEGKEPWPEDEVVVTETIENEIEDADEQGDTTTMEWDLTKKNDEDEDQMKLF
jgi:hypothetical protein